MRLDVEPQAAQEGGAAIGQRTHMVGSQNLHLLAALQIGAVFAEMQDEQLFRGAAGQRAQRGGHSPPLRVLARLGEDPLIGAGQGSRHRERGTERRQGAEIAFGKKTDAELRGLGGDASHVVAARQRKQKAAMRRAEILPVEHAGTFAIVAALRDGGRDRHTPAGGGDGRGV